MKKLSYMLALALSLSFVITSCTGISPTEAAGKLYDKEKLEYEKRVSEEDIKSYYKMGGHHLNDDEKNAIIEDIISKRAKENSFTLASFADDFSKKHPELKSLVDKAKKAFPISK